MKNYIKFLVLALFTVSVIGLFVYNQDTFAWDTYSQEASQMPDIDPETVSAHDNTDNDQNDLSTDNLKAEEYMQGVWLTTVYNLDFPSKAGLSETELKSEIDTILLNIKSKEITDVFFQVRPQADAFYYSEYYNPSIYLTGSQDVQASFDVLEYMIEKSHSLDLKLHAWINPYRISKKSTDHLASNHIAITNPELTVLHTDGNLYFDPALPEVNEYITKGVVEIIENYDIDGIHFDDYFYPDTDFDDAISYEKYGNGKSLGDFRRDNVTSLVEMVSSAVKQSDDSVVFGISPAGIWANQTSLSEGSSTRGSESYFRQYADTKKWVEDEIIDYIAPQIYWAIGFEIAEYITLVDWWNDVVSKTDVKLYIGQANYREVSGDFTQGEIQKQIDYNKTKDSVHGSIYFRYEHIK